MCTGQAVTSRALRIVRAQLDQAGITVFATVTVERAAYRDIFDYGGLLHDLDNTQISNLDRTHQNARAFS